MLRKYIVLAAVSGFALTAALARAPAPPAGQPSAPPAATTPVTPPAATPATPTGPTAATPQAGKPAFVDKQKPDQILASRFRGTSVMGAKDEKIGDVSDILFEKDGKIAAYVIGVGGFLGIGAKDVAIAPASFEMVPGQNGGDMKLKLSMTKDELKQATAFEPYRPPAPARPVTSGGPTTRPMNVPRSPSPATQ